MTVAYRATRVFDGVSEHPIEGGAVVVEEGRIVSVGPAADVPVGTETTDLGDATLLPGLIDAHVHLVWSASAEPHEVVARESRALAVLRCAANCDLHLRAGVMTVRDVGATDGLSVDVARAVELGILSGPRTVAAGRSIAMTGGHGWFLGREADGPDAVRHTVREEMKTGSTCIKLMASGGAGRMHACTLVEELGMSTVLVPRAGGVLSALGLAISDLRRDYVRPYLADLTDVKAAELKEAFKDMENTAADDLEGSRYTRRADLRYQGQSFEITVEAEKPFEVEKLEGRFHAAHKQRYGYRMDDEPVDPVNLRFIATLPVEKPKLEEPVAEGAEASSEATRRETNFGGEWIEVPVLDRERMGEGSEVEGPAVVEFKESTCVVRPSWRGVVDEVGTLVLETR